METKYDIWHKVLTEQINLNNDNVELQNINKQLLEELENCASSENSEEELYERFYKDVEFGTGGLRGILGTGTNRMNIYTVAKATQGIADYIHAEEYIKDSPLKGKKAISKPSVAMAYDSRINSEIFAKIAADVLIANNIDVYLYEELMPTPALSYAVRHFNCAMGIMITASHNPAKYNGYKVYDNSGCQVTLTAAEKIFKFIEKLNIFKDIRIHGGNGKLNILGEETVHAYLDAVQAESTLFSDEEKKTLNRLSVVYTPLNGAGNKPVREILRRLGVSKVTIVKEQELPDGNFPTCPYPNPEKREALELGLSVCEKLAEGAITKEKTDDIPDLLLATDPDCDRVGIAICENRDSNNPTYRLLSGNEVGIMLLDFLIKRKVETGRKKNPCVITTIVSTKMAEAVAAKHGIKLILTLTGFKFIGEQIGFLENECREEEYLFGFEESYGYLSGTYVRDKDAVNGAMLICEMAAYYKDKGLTLSDRLKELYQEYGYFKNQLIDFTFEGSKGMEIMSRLMLEFRNNLPDEFLGKAVVEVADYQKQERLFVKKGGPESGTVTPINLPQSDVIEVMLEGGISFTVRPSGTEPKIKIYLSAKGETEEEADRVIQELTKKLTDIVNRK